MSPHSTSTNWRSIGSAFVSCFALCIGGLASCKRQKSAASKIAKYRHLLSKGFLSLYGFTREIGCVTEGDILIGYILQKRVDDLWDKKAGGLNISTLTNLFQNKIRYL